MLKINKTADTVQNHHHVSDQTVQYAHSIQRSFSRSRGAREFYTFIARFSCLSEATLVGKDSLEKSWPALGEE